jgi:uncharacterized protein
MSRSTGILSPCVQICVLDLETRYCVGCGRTGDEIGAWLAMSPEQRRVVMAELPTRLASVVSTPEPRSQQLRQRQR